jgi:hypothetical protein
MSIVPIDGRTLPWPILAVAVEMAVVVPTLFCFLFLSFSSLNESMVFS